MDFDNGNGGPVDALPPLPPVSKDVIPIKVEPVPAKKKVMRVPIARRGLGTKGQKAQLLTNHFKVNVSNVKGPFFHYSVALFYEDGRPIDGKGVGRKVLDKKLEFTVVLENATSNRNNGSASQENDADKKRLCRAYQSKTFKVKLSFGAQIPMQANAQVVRGCKFRFSLAAKITEILVVTVSLCRVLRLVFSLVGRSLFSEIPRVESTNFKFDRDEPVDKEQHRRSLLGLPRTIAARVTPRFILSTHSYTNPYQVVSELRLIQMARRVSDYRIRRIADRGNEEDGPDSRAHGDRFYHNRRFADRWQREGGS
nr:hypothetical protein [Tanacetum cinerariifolium]